MFGNIGIHTASLRFLERDAAALHSELADEYSSFYSLTKASRARETEWLASRVLLRRFLRRLGLNLNLKMDPDFGFPELIDPVTQTPAPFFASWSHTENRIVAAGSDLPVGIDIERWDRPVAHLLRRFACDGETELLSPIELWCAKEAVAKATGLGMRWGLKNFEVLGKEGPVWKVGIRNAGPRLLKDPAVVFSTQEPYLIALCGERAQLLAALSSS